jgi:hypothetical protein
MLLNALMTICTLAAKKAQHPASYKEDIFSMMMPVTAKEINRQELTKRRKEEKKKPTPGTDEKDEWIRKPALIVLLYEGIVSGVLDFDYAPASAFIENRRISLNIHIYFCLKLKLKVTF